MKIIFVLLLIFSIQITFGQEKAKKYCSDCKSLPQPIFVPKPEYPKEAQDSGIRGTVKVQVAIDEEGNVTEAKLIEGDRIFEGNAIKAAMLAKFKPAKYIGTERVAKSFGVIVFNFVSDSISDQNLSKTVKGGICNGMAILIPKPEIPLSVINANEKGIFGIVNVQVSIDENGNVEKAQAVSGHPLMRPVAEKSAINAKFKINGDLMPAKISCLLIYNFSGFDPKKSKKEIQKETDSTIILGQLNDKALILQKPKLPNNKPPIDEEIKVKTTINSQRGEVVFAEAVLGHPLIKIEAEIAAFQTKFPSTLTGFSNVFGQGFLVFKKEDFTGI